MKNLCKKGKVHPSPPSISDHLSLLPATILTLAAALSAEDKEVLAYLISCSGTSSNSTNFTGNWEITLKSDDDDDDDDDDCSNDVRNHDPVFDCNCFNCYMSFWARWDISPNRELIHEIIEVYEEGLFQKKKKSMKKKKNKNKKEKGKRICDELKEISQKNSTEENKSRELESVEKNSNSTGETEDFEEKGTVRKITSFIGEKIWGFMSRN